MFEGQGEQICIEYSSEVFSDLLPGAEGVGVEWFREFWLVSSTVSTILITPGFYPSAPTRNKQGCLDDSKFFVEPTHEGAAGRASLPLLT